jgi:hypothetical protein
MSPTQPILSAISPELVLVDPELRSRAQRSLPEPAASWEVPSRPPRTKLVVASNELPATASAEGASRRGRRLGMALLLSVTAASLTANALTIAGTWRSSGPTSTVSASTTGAATKPSTQRAVVRQRQRSNAPAAAHPRKQQDRRASATPRKHTRTVRQANRPVAAPQSKTIASTQRAAGAIVTRRTEADRASVSWHPVTGASYYNLVLWRGDQRLLDVWPTSTHVLLPRTWTYKGVRGSLSPGRYLWFAYPGFGTRASARYGKPLRSGILIVTRAPDTKASQ